MIAAQELRIGNLFIDDLNQLCITKKIDEDAVMCFCPNCKKGEWSVCEIKKVIPIPLTEEWLLKFGFETDGNFEDKNEIILPNNEHDFIIEFSDYTKNYHYTGGEGICYGVGCKYVHQLQNLYFALTGEELILKS